MGPGIVTLSGEAISDTQEDPTNAIAGLRVNTDGTIDQVTQAGAAQIDSATDWIIPNVRANSLYEVSVTGVTGDPFDLSPPGSNGDWFDLSANRTWQLTQATTGSKNCSFTLNIRYNGGATIDTGSYSLSVTVNPGG